MKLTFLLVVAGLVMVCKADCAAQCKETVSPSNHKKVHYHRIPLSGPKEYLSLSKTGEERILSYHNDDFEQVYHVQMFTEIQFSSVKGNFSIYSTINSTDRSNWERNFVLSSPIEPKELEKMKGTFEIIILLPDDRRVFRIDAKKNQLMHQAIACMH